jgi:hypothetical protein
MIKDVAASDTGAPTNLQVILNWFEELNTKLK